MTLAILSALPEEQSGLANALQQARFVTRAGRSFVQGQLYGVDVVLALSGIGKVAAATTTTTLIEHFGIQALVFTGVAGGIGDKVQVGDVVVAHSFLQHDMDVRPLFPRWVVPSYGRAVFACDLRLASALHTAAQLCTQSAAQWNTPLLGGHAPAVHQGLIVSGDQFIVSSEVSRKLHQDLRAAQHLPLAVEMEGAAIAQVCADYGTPFAAVRTISDRADEAAHVDFPAFVQTIASRYAQHIMEHFVLTYSKLA